MCLIIDRSHEYAVINIFINVSEPKDNTRLRQVHRFIVIIAYIILYYIYRGVNTHLIGLYGQTELACFYYIILKNVHCVHVRMHNS